MKRLLRSLTHNPQACPLFADSASAEQTAHVSGLRPNTLL